MNSMGKADQTGNNKSIIDQLLYIYSTIDQQWINIYRPSIYSSTCIENISTICQHLSKTISHQNKIYQDISTNHHPLLKISNNLTSVYLKYVSHQSTSNFPTAPRAMKMLTDCKTSANTFSHKRTRLIERGSQINRKVYIERTSQCVSNFYSNKRGNLSKNRSYCNCQVPRKYYAFKKKNPNGP